MAYRITGLNPTAFAPLFAMNDAELAARRAVRVVADASPGFPCRVSLEDARVGESLILVHHVSHNVATPFRSSHAIYVREGAHEAPTFIDTLPPVFATRTLSLRGFDAIGMLRDARLAPPGEAEAGILALFADPAIAVIHAHNAAPGCFAAAITRHGDYHGDHHHGDAS